MDGSVPGLAVTFQDKNCWELSLRGFSRVPIRPILVALCSISANLGNANCIIFVS
jgi:hypothetical protein